MGGQNLLVWEKDGVLHALPARMAIYGYVEENMLYSLIYRIAGNFCGV